jgi:hypothetical protein
VLLGGGVLGLFGIWWGSLFFIHYKETRQACCKKTVKVVMMTVLGLAIAFSLVSILFTYYAGLNLNLCHWLYEHYQNPNFYESVRPQDTSLIKLFKTCLYANSPKNITSFLSGES